MATLAHCAYCFESLSASLEKRQPLSLAEVEELWDKYASSTGVVQQDQGDADDAEDDDDDPSLIMRIGGVLVSEVMVFSDCADLSLFTCSGLQGPGSVSLE